jgi:hypothetical protein
MRQHTTSDSMFIADHSNRRRRRVMKFVVAFPLFSLLLCCRANKETKGNSQSTEIGELKKAVSELRSELSTAEAKIADLHRSYYPNSTDPQDWFIESYENGVITAQHEGYTYKARFDIRISGEGDSFRESHSCMTAIGLVGHAVQPFGGNQKDANGHTIVMIQNGAMLVLQSRRDKIFLSQEEFIVTSVEKKTL